MKVKGQTKKLMYPYCLSSMTHKNGVSQDFYEFFHTRPPCTYCFNGIEIRYQEGTHMHPSNNGASQPPH